MRAVNGCTAFSLFIFTVVICRYFPLGAWSSLLAECVCLSLLLRIVVHDPGTPTEAGDSQSEVCVGSVRGAPADGRRGVSSRLEALERQYYTERHPPSLPGHMSLRRLPPKVAAARFFLGGARGPSLNTEREV